MLVYNTLTIYLCTCMYLHPCTICMDVRYTCIVWINMDKYTACVYNL